MSKNSFYMKRVQTFNCVVIYTKNCEVILKKNENESVLIPQGVIAIIEKNMIFDIVVTRVGDGVLYDSFYVSDSELRSLKHIFDVLNPLTSETYLRKREISDRIFFIKNGVAESEIFTRLKKNSNERARVYKLAYLFSKVEDIPLLISSLSISTTVTFTEKIRGVISTDIRKKWRLSDVSEIINLSEISIRKKLESEFTNFNSVVLDLRMNKAIEYLAHSERHINTIANMIGYSSVSYFIRGFKDYYGITPKQFVIGLKRTRRFQ